MYGYDLKCWTNCLHTALTLMAIFNKIVLLNFFRYVRQLKTFVIYTLCETGSLLVCDKWFKLNLRK